MRSEVKKNYHMPGAKDGRGCGGIELGSVFLSNIGLAKQNRKSYASASDGEKNRAPAPTANRVPPSRAPAPTMCPHHVRPITTTARI